MRGVSQDCLDCFRCQWRRRKPWQIGMIGKGAVAGIFELFSDADASCRCQLTAPDGSVLADSLMPACANHSPGT